MKYVLSIAGSDSSGGAGLQADIKTFASHQTYGMTVLTVLTAQNPKEILAIQETSPSFITKQMDAIFSFHKPNATKIGVLWSSNNVQVIAKALKKYKANNIVVDPVMISTSKSKLIVDNTIKALIKYLFPLATIITPNYYEAEILSGTKINNQKDVERAAKKISTFFDGCILIKGGHNSKNANDYFYSKKESFWLYAPKISKIDAHGTGCTLSSAIAANLAKNDGIVLAVKKAKAYVYNSIYNRSDGLLNHNKGFINKLPLFYQLINENVIDWEKYTNHNFVNMIVKETLNYDKFIYYLKQDHLYLKEFNKTFVDLSKKAKTKAEKSFCKQKLDFIINNEQEVYKLFTNKKDNFKNIKVSKTCLNYTNFLRKNNLQWDFLDLLVALSVCYIGYAFVGKNIKENQTTEKNKYANWIKEYSSNKFLKLANEYITFINKYSGVVNEEKMKKLSQIFKQACKLEAKFFDQATT